MELIKKISILFICIIFIFSALAAAQEAEKESKEVMNEILDNAEQIKSAEKNVTGATQLLASLPEAEEKPRVAIYNIQDKTGKRDETGSQVLTQGATDMMITALKRSRQVKILDRSKLGDFMNEQQLQSDDRLASGEGPDLGQLAGADYVIDGAITEYQVDKKSGGTGLTIAGAGGTKEHAVASTALDIRLVDTTTGEVVWSTSLKDEIKGEKIGLESFSFMGDNIVEFETGEGKQEVINLVVRTIIEEAVFEMSQEL
ncbi:MAG: CsgG/HfaB family protein [Bacillota bacterium]